MFYLKNKKNVTNIQSTHNHIYQNTSKKQLLIGGEKSMMYHFAKCCLPAEKTNLVAYASNSREFIIHHKNCLNLHKVDQERIVEVKKEDI